MCISRVCKLQQAALNPQCPLQWAGLERRSLPRPANCLRTGPAAGDCVLRRDRAFQVPLLEEGQHDIVLGDEAAMLTIFDVFDDWFREGAAQVSSFLHVLMETGPDHPLGKASIQYLDRTRQQIAELAESAGLNDPHDFARPAHILIKGAIVAAAEGDSRAAGRARTMAKLLMDHHRSQK